MIILTTFTEGVILFARTIEQTRNKPTQIRVKHVNFI